MQRERKDQISTKNIIAYGDNNIRKHMKIQKTFLYAKVILITMPPYDNETFKNAKEKQESKRAIGFLQII